MAARRIATGLMLCVGVLHAVPARAEDPAALTQPLNTTIFEDAVDSIGGILGVLVGPPISSPTPYIEGREPPARVETPRKEEGKAVKTAVPTPAPVLAPSQPPASVPPAANPAAVAPPAPEPVPLPAVAVPPPPVVKGVTLPPAAPPPRPAAPVAVTPATPAAPAAVAQPVPACSVRVAATATLDQMRRLPRCP